MLRATLSLIRLLLLERSSIRFAVGVWLGLSFSIAVILGTIGIMDGFDQTMRTALRKSQGDIYLYGRSGFFDFEAQDEKLSKEAGINIVSPYIQSEAFLVAKGTSKGVSVRGVDNKSFSELSELDIKPLNNEVVVGSELASLLDLKAGSRVVLALAKGNRSISALPLLKRFVVSAVVTHGIYEKDLRFIYMNKDQLSNLLQLDDKVNVVAFKVDTNFKDMSIDEHIAMVQFRLEEIFGNSFRLIPYWYEYGHLLEAVKIQKVTIALILQIIVVVSIFNVLVFVTFLNAKKAREIFLFQALGMNQNHMTRAWLSVVCALWLLSCTTSIFLVKFFGILLGNMSLFELPGSVYSVARLNLVIGTGDYLLVFFSSFAWLLFIVYFALWKIRKQPILRGLRQEFT
jgi:ABC-type lipoprotein release transport system permease subunit